MQLGTDKEAIITGGASGLGAAVAERLIEQGVRVTLLDLDARNGPKVAERLGAAFIEVDVTDPAAVSSALDQIDAVQICMNCAGIAPAAKTIDRDGTPHDPALFEKVIRINLLGTFNVATQAAARMAHNAPTGDDGERGVIINTASIAAYEGQIGQIGYASSKGAVASMTLPMARDLAKHGIRVNAIAPGLFKTPMVAGLPEDVQTALGAAVPYPPRLGNPAEFASLVCHIIENGMMNGETIRLDGAIRLPPR